MSTHKQWVLVERPKAEINDQTFKLESVTTPKADSLKDGDVLVRTVDLSCDPAQRGWLNDARSYVPPVKIGEVMRANVRAIVDIKDVRACLIRFAQGIGVAVASKSKRYAKGDVVMGLLGWTEFAVLSEKGLRKIEYAPMSLLSRPLVSRAHRVPKGAQASDFLGLLGSSGQTAYWGLEDVGRIKAGEVIVVSGAAGSVGSVACQIAKLRGCRVFATAGTDEKCRWLEKDLGVEKALNYKSPNFRKEYKSLPYVDCLFDNVGGAFLDLALVHLNQKARIVLCGAISACTSNGAVVELVRDAARRQRVVRPQEYAHPHLATRKDGRLYRVRYTTLLVTVCS
jgi:hypothetical protein